MNNGIKRTGAFILMCIFIVTALLLVPTLWIGLSHIATLNFEAITTSPRKPFDVSPYLLTFAVVAFTMLVIAIRNLKKYIDSTPADH